MKRFNFLTTFFRSFGSDSLSAKFWSYCWLMILGVGFSTYFYNSSNQNSGAQPSGTAASAVVSGSTEAAQLAFAFDKQYQDAKATVYRAFYLMESKNEAANKELQGNWEKQSKELEKSFNDLTASAWTGDEWKALTEQAKKDYKEFTDATTALMPLVFQMKNDEAKGKLAAVEGCFGKLESFQLKTKEQFAKNFGAKQSGTGAGAGAGASVQGTAWYFSLTAIWCLMIICLSWMYSSRTKWAFRNRTNKISAVGHQLVAMAKTFTESSESLASATTEQTAALQETAATLDEISAMVKRTEENATNLEHIAKKNQETADKGKDSVREMVTSIGAIQGSVDNLIKQVEGSNVQISEIVNVIKNIGAKTKVINDIVFQTKLLSFNASVEAARAGEHGKGFAVVAQEVGNLAQMSGNAAKEISDMLGQSVSRVEEIVRDNKQKVETLMADGKSKVEEGTKVATNVEASLQQIIEQSETVNLMIKEISSGVVEQSKGIREIVKTISMMNTSTESIATATEEGAANAKTLHTYSSDISKMVREFEDAFVGASKSSSTDAWAAASTSERGASKHHPKKTFSATASSVASGTARKAAPPVAKTPPRAPPATRKDANVVAFKRPEASAAKLSAKLSVKPPMKVKNPATASKSEYLQATGTDNIPSSEDPRFEDI